MLQLHFSTTYWVKPLPRFGQYKPSLSLLVCQTGQSSNGVLNLLEDKDVFYSHLNWNRRWRVWSVCCALTHFLLTQERTSHKIEGGTYRMDPISSDKHQRLVSWSVGQLNAITLMVETGSYLVTWFHVTWFYCTKIVSKENVFVISFIISYRYVIYGSIGNSSEGLFHFSWTLTKSGVDEWWRAKHKLNFDIGKSSCPVWKSYLSHIWLHRLPQPQISPNLTSPI